MSHDDSLESILSDEELRALLRDHREPETAPSDEKAQGVAAAPKATSLPGRETPGERPAVILASRRSADAGLLSERLAASGFRVDVVRNAFRALDLLRSRTYVAVLTDFDLWADGARLLFERIEGVAEPPLVVLLSDRGAAPGSRPRKAGVAGELLCPLSALEVEVAVEQLTAAVTDSGEAVPTEERRGLIGELRETVRSGSRTDAPIGSGESRDALLASRSALALGPYRWEIPWLRFFLEAQRRLRTGASRDALLSALVGLGGEVLGAEATGIAVVTGGELMAHVNVASVQSDESARRPSLAEVSDYLESPADDSSRPWDGPAVFSLEVPFPSGPHGDASPRPSEENLCRVVFFGLSRPIRSAALTFREDLRALVIEALKRR